MNTKDWYTPYINAIDKILQGEWVEGLDTIRVECNRKYHATQQDKTQLSYHPTMIVLTFAAQAENNILAGMPVEKAYQRVAQDKEISHTRVRMRSLLEQVVKNGHL